MFLQYIQLQKLPRLLQTLLPHTLAFAACTDLARRRGVRAERAALWPLSNHLDTGGGVWPVEWRPMAT